MIFALPFSFLLNLVLLHQVVKRNVSNLTQYIITFFILFVGIIIPSGYILSCLNSLNLPVAWALLSSGIALLLFIFQFKKKVQFIGKECFRTLFRSLKYIYIEESIYFKILIYILTLGLVSCIFLNFIILYFAIPNEWDSMTGHLVKCAYYLQNGNMNRIQGTTWTIDFYPNSLPTLQIYFYLLFNSEKGFIVIHYLSYWMFCVSMYGICRNLGQKIKSSFFVFLLAALLPTALVQATTTETDLVFTAYLSCVVYYMTLIKHRAVSRIDIIILALILSIWVSHKSTFLLVLPSLGVAFLYFLSDLKKSDRFILCISVVFCCIIYVLPNGYLNNMIEEKSYSPSAISAPKNVLSYHSISNYSFKQVLKYGTKNVFRYAFDFFSLDGIRNGDVGEKINQAMRKVPILVLKPLNLEEKVFWVVGFFSFEPKFSFYKERPYWGSISFLLVFPMMIYVLVKSKKQNIPYILLILISVIHYLSLSYTAPYDPIKGRYFMNMAVWALPFAGLWLLGKYSNFKQLFLVSCSIFIVGSALGTVLFRNNYPLVAQKNKKNIFEMNRLEMRTTGRPDFYPAIQKYESIVPPNAKVAVALLPEDFEYLLFGENLNRKLMAIKPFQANLKPIPKEAEYLFYTKGVIDYQTGDIRLNGRDETIGDTPMPENEFYLRKLNR